MPAELNVFITCMREEENLKILLPRLEGVLKKFGITYKILVIDTVAPMDGTRDVCRNFENVVCLPTEGKTDGYGNAVRTGIKNLDGKYAILMDGDLSQPPEAIADMLPLREKYDMTIASRYTEGGASDDRAINRLMSRALNIACSAIMRIDCKDWSTSFKLYQTSQLQALSLTCRDFDIHQEITCKLHRNRPNFKFAEIPMRFSKRLHGSSTRRISYGLSILKTLIKLRLRLL